MECINTLCGKNTRVFNPFFLFCKEKLNEAYEITLLSVCFLCDPCRIKRKQAISSQKFMFDVRAGDIMTTIKLMT
jgi:hypothetical protein